MTRDHVYEGTMFYNAREGVWSFSTPWDDFLVSDKKLTEAQGQLRRILSDGAEIARKGGFLREITLVLDLSNMRCGWVSREFYEGRVDKLFVGFRGVRPLRGEEDARDRAKELLRKEIDGRLRKMGHKDLEVELGY